MSDTKSGDENTLTVNTKKTLTLKRPGVEQSTVRQNFSHGRTKSVVVETKRKFVKPGDRPDPSRIQQSPAPAASRPQQPPVTARSPEPAPRPQQPAPQPPVSQQPAPAPQPAPQRPVAQQPAPQQPEQRAQPAPVPAAPEQPRPQPLVSSRRRVHGRSPRSVRHTDLGRRAAPTASPAAWC
jgi:translation initiation factor IF-2